LSTFFAVYLLRKKTIAFAIRENFIRTKIIYGCGDIRWKMPYITSVTEASGCQFHSVINRGRQILKRLVLCVIFTVETSLCPQHYWKLYVTKQIDS